MTQKKDVLRKKAQKEQNPDEEEEELWNGYDEIEAEDRFVWHDEVGYKKARRRAFWILLGGLIPAVVFYLVMIQWFTGVEGFAIALAVIIWLFLVPIFHRRVIDCFATYIRYEGNLIRVASANRAITRVCLHNDEPAENFPKDLNRAAAGRGCVILENVRHLEEDKRGYRVTAVGTHHYSKKKREISFYLENGYNDMEDLLEELKERQSGEA